MPVPVVVSVMIPVTVTAAIAHFISSKVANMVQAILPFGSLAAIRVAATIAIVRMEAVVYMSAEVVAAMEPRTGADKPTASEPF